MPFFKKGYKGNIYDDILIILIYYVLLTVELIVVNCIVNVFRYVISYITNIVKYLNRVGTRTLFIFRKHF